MPLPADQVLTVVGAGVALVEQIVQWAHEGLSDAEIRKRIASPTGVGQQLITAAKTRKKKLDDFVKNG